MAVEKKMNVDERLELFTELLSCQGNYYMWSYDLEGNLLGTNCSYLYLDSVLKRADCYRELLEYAQDQNMPIIISATFGLMWGAAVEHSKEGRTRIHIIGPAFTQMPSRAELESFLRGISPAVRHWSPKLIRRLESLPVITFNNFCQRVMMLHYCIYNEHIQPSDITLYTGVIDMLKKSQPAGELLEEEGSAERPDRNKVYHAERALLNLVREGNLHYKETLADIASVFNGKQKLARNSLQHAKLSQVVIIALASRAAIEGGVSPEIIYPRQDAYIRDVDNSTGAPAITEVGFAMLDDFIHLVHDKKTERQYSKPIASCCDYIEAHLEDKLTISDLARRVGYTDYYLSRKFKTETGISVNDYIKKVRIQRAKDLMATTDLSIQEISDRLGFGARSFFAETFKQAVGIPPAQWRNENKVM